MIPLAITLGLSIPLSFIPINLPTRMQVPKGIFDPQPHMIYIGQGHHTHRTRVSHWSSPYTTGAHGTDEEVLITYCDWLHSSGLIDTIDTLLGMTLLTDKEPGVPCESDVLIAECYSYLIRQEETMPHRDQREARNRKRSSRVKPLGLLIAQAHSAEAVCRYYGKQYSPAGRPSRGPWQRWPQEAIVAVFISLFPAQFFEGFQFPMIEDAVNRFPFCDYVEWRDSRDLDNTGPQGPALVNAADNRLGRISEGLQSAAFSKKGALPPIVSFGLDPDEHFNASLHKASMPSPFEFEGV